MFGSILSGIGVASKFLGNTAGKVSSFLGNNSGSIIGGLSQLGSSALSTPLQLYGSKKLMKRQVELNREYNSWLIPFQNDQNLQYQMRYLQNSPNATVKGLRKAGLNPILAASGGFSTGSPSGASGGSSGSGGGLTAPNTRVDIMALQNLQKQNEVLDSQKSELQSRSAANTLNAETNRMRAEADIRNQTMETNYNVKQKDVETALRTLEVERRKNGNNYDSAQLRDASQVLNHALDSAIHGWDYLNNSPSSKSFKFSSRHVRPSTTFGLSSEFLKKAGINTFDIISQGIFPLLFHGLRKVGKSRYSPLHIR